MPREVVYKPIDKINKIYAGGTITPPKFMPTRQEFLFENAEQIIKNNGVVGGGNAIIYTVPKEHFFYLTHSHIAGETSGASKICGVRIDGVVSLYSVYLEDITPAHAEVNYIPPLILDEGQVLQVWGTDASVFAFATITGFLIPKNLL